MGLWSPQSSGSPDDFAMWFALRIAIFDVSGSPSDLSITLDTMIGKTEMVPDSFLHQ